MQRHSRRLLKAAALLAGGTVAMTLSAQDHVTVDVKRKPGDAAWTPRPTVCVEHLEGFTPGPAPEYGRFGGRTDRRGEATGFFRTENVDGRWRILDPEGFEFLGIACNSVSMSRTDNGRRALEERFGSEDAWAGKVTGQLRELGFNMLGCWSDWQRLRAVENPLPYTTQWNFMSSYGKKRGGTYQLPGHTGYPEGCVFVFDPEFETFCREHAKQLVALRDDPYLFGHFSDNELPFHRGDLLERYLKLPENDPGHRAAQAWLDERLAGRENKAVADTDRWEFRELVVARYHRIVRDAIREADPNHLYLGSRIHGGSWSAKSVVRAVAEYTDILTVNMYGQWTPSREALDMWREVGGKPFMITEWYAKGVDSGMKNETGAGWLVKTQADRGRFYQNFTLGLLRDPACVGWHWFKYQDNDPTDTRADPSNLDSNKGFVSNRYEPYEPLTNAMQELNRNAHDLRDYLLR